VPPTPLPSDNPAGGSTVALHDVRIFRVIEWSLVGLLLVTGLLCFIFSIMAWMDNLVIMPILSILFSFFFLSVAYWGRSRCRLTHTHV
jgi:hypothetical protein